MHRKISGDVSNNRGLRLLDPDSLRKIFSFLDCFDLARCSAVCKSWCRVIHDSTLWKDLLEKQHGKSETDCGDKLIYCQRSLNIYLSDLAMERHRKSLVNGTVCIHQWACHSKPINQCQIRMGVILTGVGDKVLRMWSSRSYECLREYLIPTTNPLVDFDFDENKIVGLVGNRLYVWRHQEKQSVLVSPGGQSPRGYCMRYMDPEAVIGCADGSARIYDMYSRTCSQIIRMHAGPVTCLVLSDDQLIISGCSLGSVSVADVSSRRNITSLKTSTAPTGISSLYFNQSSHYIYAGSTSGFAHCWDLRTFKPLWETRASPNVLYSMHCLVNDTLSLVVGGIDGVLRIMNPSTGDVLSSYIPGSVTGRSSFRNGFVQRDVTQLSEGSRIDAMPKHFRPPITSIAVGMEKVVTTHNDKYISMWKFNS